MLFIDNFYLTNFIWYLADIDQFYLRHFAIYPPLPSSTTHHHHHHHQHALLLVLFRTDIFVDLVNTHEVSWRSDLRGTTNIQQLRRQNWQPLNLACGTLFRSSCAIRTSPMRTVQTTAEGTSFFWRHEHGALWLLIYGVLEKHCRIASHRCRRPRYLYRFWRFREVAGHEDSLLVLRRTASAAICLPVSSQIHHPDLGNVSRLDSSGLWERHPRRHSIVPAETTPVGDERRRPAGVLFAEIRPRHGAPAPAIHWLKAPERIDYKLAVIVYKCQHGSAPPYLADELCRPADIEGRRCLRSASSPSLIVRRTRLSTVATVLFRLLPLVSGTICHSTSRLQNARLLQSPQDSSLSAAFRDILTFVVPEKWLYHSGHVNRFCYLLTYVLKISPGLRQRTLKLTELTPGHWFFATPISLALNEHVLCPSHLLRTVCSKPVRWGQVWAAGSAGPPSAVIAVRPTTFSAPTLHLSTSVFFATPRFSIHTMTPASCHCIRLKIVYYCNGVVHSRRVTIIQQICSMKTNAKQAYKHINTNEST